MIMIQMINTAIGNDTNYSDTNDKDTDNKSHKSSNANDDKRRLYLEILMIRERRTIMTMRRNTA